MLCVASNLPQRGVDCSFRNIDCSYYSLSVNYKALQIIYLSGLIIQKSYIFEVFFSLLLPLSVYYSPVCVVSRTKK